MSGNTMSSTLLVFFIETVIVLVVMAFLNRVKPLKRLILGEKI